MAVGAACTIAFCTVYTLAVRTEPGQRLDAWLFGVAQVSNPVLVPAARALRSGLPYTLALVVAVLLVAAIVRASWARVIAAALVSTAPVLARVLRDEVLGRPDLGDNAYPFNTFPSGHVAATAALVVAALMLWPGTIRGEAVAAAVLVVAAGWAASVIGHAHRPADGLGSLLLVAALTAVACAVVDRRMGHTESRPVYSQPGSNETERVSRRRQQRRTPPATGNTTVR